VSAEQILLFCLIVLAASLALCWIVFESVTRIEDSMNELSDEVTLRALRARPAISPMIVT
jgi:hypothetical protein